MSLRRFYQSVRVEERAVLLDDHRLTTPGHAPLLAPTVALAEAIAAEWAGQGEEIRPDAMPLTRLANVAIDRTPQARAAIVDEARRYAGTDLLCHRAETPQALASRHAAAWDPWLDWAKTNLGARLAVGVGVSALDQPETSLDAIATAAQAFDDWRLTGFAHAMGLMGSVVLAQAMAHRAIGAEAAFSAAFLDDLWQLERWGEDALARARLERMRDELAALSRFFAALDSAASSP